MTIFQIFAILFGLIMMYLLSIHRRRAHLSDIEISFWYTIWAVFIVLAIAPQLLLTVSDALRFSRVFDLLLVAGMMIITTVSIVNYLTARSNQYKLEQLVRDRAIDHATQKETEE